MNYLFYFWTDFNILGEIKIVSMFEGSSFLSRDLWDKGQYYSPSTKGDSKAWLRLKVDMEFLIS